MNGKCSRAHGFNSQCIRASLSLSSKYKFDGISAVQHQDIITNVYIMRLDDLTGQLSLAQAALLLISSICVIAAAQSPTGTHGDAYVLKHENYVVFEASSI